MIVKNRLKLLFKISWFNILLIIILGLITNKYIESIISILGIMIGVSITLNYFEDN